MTHLPTALRPALAPVLAACVLLACAMPALGFGAQGHRVIAAFADTQLSPKARSAVRRGLDGESLAQAATWADDMREAPDDAVFWGYDHAANWHFINIPEGLDLARAPRHEAGDAYSALLAFDAVLADRPLAPGPIREGLERYLGEAAVADGSRELDALALRFLIHLVGDLHQPLHVGYEEDRGGNDFDLRWLGRPSNLHRVWDSQLLARAGRSDREWRARLRRLNSVLPEAERRRLMLAEPDVWLTEALALRREIYRAAAGARLDADQADAWTPILERRLLAAGLRLAAMLERLYG